MIDGWFPIASAYKDRAILVYCPPCEGLDELYSVCRWHPDAGFCVDEIRSPTHWRSLPERPK